jgi:hypothetical protein
MQPPYENNIPRPFRAGLLIRGKISCVLRVKFRASPVVYYGNRRRHLAILGETGYGKDRDLREAIPAPAILGALILQ